MGTMGYILLRLCGFCFFSFFTSCVCFLVEVSLLYLVCQLVKVLVFLLGYCSALFVLGLFVAFFVFVEHVSVFVFAIALSYEATQYSKPGVACVVGLCISSCALLVFITSPHFVLGYGLCGFLR